MVTLLENLPAPTVKKMNLVVEGQLYHANTELVPKAVSQSLNFPADGTITTQQTLMFPIKIRDLPKVRGTN